MAIGLQAFSNDNGVLNVGPICANFPTGTNAYAPEQVLQTDDNLLNSQQGRYGNQSYICPTGQWLVGIRAQTSSDRVHKINQAICQTWNQEPATGLVSRGGIVGQPNLSPGWKVANGFLVGPGVNLANQNLSGANLSGVNLGNANLDGTNLTNANLDYVTSNGITGSPSLNGGYGLRRGYLLGSKVSLWGAALNGEDLSNWSMPGASFVNTNLSSVDFYNATLSNVFFGHYSTSMNSTNLYGSNLSYANMSYRSYNQGQNLSGTNCTGALFIRTDLDGGTQSQNVGGSWYFNNTNLTNTTIANSGLTGNLSTVNFTNNGGTRNWNYGSWRRYPTGWGLNSTGSIVR